MIKVGLVGYGFMGGMHSQCYQATGKAKIVAVADVEADRCDKAAADLNCETFDSIEAMLESVDVDVVDICTPTYLHEDHVLAVAEAGKHIMCEKPMSLSVESCDRMIAATTEAGVKMMVGHVIRFWPEYQVIKELVDSGNFGKAQWASARRLSPPPTWAWQGWLSDPEKSGGAILDLHIHDVDFLAYLFGSPKAVFATGVKSTRGAFDSAFTTGLGHSSGTISYAEGSLALSTPFPFNMALTVCCENGSIKFDMAVSPSLMVYPNDGEPFAPEVPEIEVGSSETTGGNISSLGGYYNEIEYFVNCVADGVEPEIVTPQSAREAVKICLAARESAQSETIVNIA
jgi:predicted dehydrogenase